ncbi:MAG: type II toxin-antitoxin system RelE/ParE family toxin [Spirochaetaceae bacterium]|nr:type II toxin-antitoxin system RelE/ParE family toxin [Spirochaetaceae bacterium]
MRFKVIVSEPAAAYLRSIDGRTRKQIQNKLRDLEESPEQRGSPLLGELQGYRCIRAAGQRYRVIYYVEKEQVIVAIVQIGIRKEGDKNDIYEVAKRLLAAGLIDSRK